MCCFPFKALRSGSVAIWMMLWAAGCTAAARDDDRAAKPAAGSTPAPQRTAAVPLKAEPGTQPPSAATLPQPPRDESKHGALELAGDLRPSEAADLSFKISGQLVTVEVERGQRVKRGQLLATLADAEARAQLAQAAAAVVQADAQLQLARDNETRTAGLVATNAAPGSQATAVRLQAAGAQAALMQAQAARAHAEATLANHRLKAPFDGEVVKVPDGVGGIVAPGTPLFRIESLDPLVLRATVGEADVNRIRVGDDVTIETADRRKITGKVRLVLRSLEASSRRVPIEVVVPNQNRSLIAGSYVRATHKPR